MNEYLIKYYLDDEVKNPCKDCEVEIVKGDNVDEAIVNLAEYLKNQINTNQHSELKCSSYMIEPKMWDYISLELYNPQDTKAKRIFENYIIDSIEGEIKL